MADGSPTSGGEAGGPAARGEETGPGAGAPPEPGAWPPHGFPCSLCKRLFSSLEHLREHEYRHTLSLMALSLDWPGARDRPAPRPQPLHYHQPLYRPGGGAPEAAPARYLCSQCPASFTLKSNADRHEKTIHYKKKLMQCAYCLKHFRDRTDLHRHLSSVHSRERGYACPACAKAFSTQKNLATHVKACCQLGPGDLLAGGAGMEMSQGGVIDSLWRLSQEMKVDHRNLGIDVEDRYGLACEASHLRPE
ncbi:gastrula zinc finger protein XlCGF7.1-like isoform X2 [Pungitius pungitius]